MFDQSINYPKSHTSTRRERQFLLQSKSSIADICGMNVCSKNALVFLSMLIYVVCLSVCLGAHSVYCSRVFFLSPSHSLRFYLCHLQMFIILLYLFSVLFFVRLRSFQHQFCYSQMTNTHKFYSTCYPIHPLMAKNKPFVPMRREETLTFSTVLCPYTDPNSLSSPSTKMPFRKLLFSS